MSAVAYFTAARSYKRELIGDPTATLSQEDVRLLNEATVARWRSGGALDAFPAALKELLKHEGGYVNHPADPGGRTNLGVTQRVWEAWTGKPATEAAMRALTPEAVAPLYRKHYWDAVNADDLPPGLALNVFDFGVNSGPKRAIQFLQQMSGAMVDGVIGPITIASVKVFVGLKGEAFAICSYSGMRRHFYRTRKTFPVFGKGWLRRVDEVEAVALRLLA